MVCSVFLLESTPANAVLLAVQERTKCPRDLDAAIIVKNIDRIKELLGGDGKRADCDQSFNLRVGFGLAEVVGTPLHQAVGTYYVEAIRFFLVGPNPGAIINVSLTDAGGLEVVGFTSLMLAARVADSRHPESVEILRLMVTSIDGPERDTVNEDGDTALMVGMKAPNFAVEHLEPFLELGCDMKIQSADGDTALMLAIKNSEKPFKAEVFTKLLASKHSLGIDAQNKAGKTALMLGFSSPQFTVQHLDRFLLLRCNLNLQDEDGNTAIMQVLSGKRTDLFNRLLADPNIDLTLQNKAGDTALTIAMRNEVFEVQHLEKLVKKECNVNQKNAEGNTALMLALMNDKIDSFVTLLGTKGIDLDAQNQAGETALTLAMGKSWFKDEHLASFLAKMCNVNLQNADGNTASMLAFTNNKADLFDRLLPNIQNKAGETALLIGMTLDSFKVKHLELFLKKECKVNQQNADGNNALMLAFIEDRQDANFVEPLLAVANIDLAAQNKAGDTTLMLALTSRWMDDVDQLEAIAKKCNVNQQNAEGNNALMIALIENNVRFVPTLLDIPNIDIAAQNKAGLTALHQLALHPNVRPEDMIPILERFKKSGVNGLLTEDGQTALQLLLKDNPNEWDHLPVMLEHGVPVRIPGEVAPSCLQLAIQNERWLQVGNLLKYGAAVDKDMKEEVPEELRRGLWLTMHQTENVVMDRDDDDFDSEIEKYMYKFASDLLGRSTSPWAFLWTPPEKCYGDLRYSCSGDENLLGLVRLPAFAKLLLDGQTGGSEEDKLEARKKAVHAVLSVNWVNKPEDVVSVICATGGCNGLEAEDEDLGLSEEFIKRLESWNRLHWAAYACFDGAMSEAVYDLDAATFKEMAAQTDYQGATPFWWAVHQHCSSPVYCPLKKMEGVLPFDAAAAFLALLLCLGIMAISFFGVQKQTQNRCLLAGRGDAGQCVWARPSPCLCQREFLSLSSSPGF